MRLESLNPPFVTFSEWTFLFTLPATLLISPYFPLHVCLSFDMLGNDLSLLCSSLSRCMCVHMYVCRYVGWMCVCVGACMSVQFNVLGEMCDRAFQFLAYMSVKAELEKDGRQWRTWWSWWRFRIQFLNSCLGLHRIFIPYILYSSYLETESTMINGPCLP